METDEGVFGVNFADGRIKGYPKTAPGAGGIEARHFVRLVRGEFYGTNDFRDNGDGTVTDRATGLMWTQEESSIAMTWKDALAYAEDLELAGYRDWRLPNAKELQSIVDYSRAPFPHGSADAGPAIDPMFNTSTTESWEWTSTTHQDDEGGKGGMAVYICLGRALGYVFPPAPPWGGDPPPPHLSDVHGAGAQRSDFKAGNAELNKISGIWESTDYPLGFGPQHDQVRVLNYVRCVRNGATLATGKTPKPAKRERLSLGPRR
jgi:hypothetical protein